MELDSIRQRVSLWIGWLSIVTGLLSLAVINIGLLWGIQIPIGNNISLLLAITLILGIFSAINKRSRTLGLWGIGLGIYLGVFLIVMFLLGWAINPFP